MKTQKKEIYILLTHTGTVVSKLINLYTKKYYTHASIALDKDFNALYSFGRQYAWLPFIAGFVKEDPNDGLYLRIKHVNCIVYRMPVTHKQYKKIEKAIVKFSREPAKYKYNIIGLFAFVFKRRILVKDHYFCSQFVAKVLKDSGLDIFDKPEDLVQPDDFMSLKNIEAVYSGEIKNYRMCLQRK